MSGFQLMQGILHLVKHFISRIIMEVGVPVPHIITIDDLQQSLKVERRVVAKCRFVGILTERRSASAGQ
jgi:hypothetical protein